jgi:hypothetical protein
MQYNDRYQGRHAQKSMDLISKRMIDGGAWKELNLLLDMVENDSGSTTQDAADMRQAIANRLDEFRQDPVTPYGLVINAIREDPATPDDHWRKRWHLDATADGPVLHCERSNANGCGCSHMEPVRTGLGYVRMVYALRRHVARDHSDPVAVG